jgi:hypothetical protein
MNPATSWAASPSGCASEHVRVYQTDNGEILGGTTFISRELPDPFERAVCCMASPIAEQQLTGTPSRRVTSMSR